MHHIARGLVPCLLAAGLWISGGPAFAQESDTSVGIVSVAAGGLFGLGAHGSIAGSFAYPTTKYLVPFVEIAYSPLISYGYQYGNQNAGKGLFRSNLLDANGGVKIRFTSDKSDWAPYIGVGAGVLRVASTDTTAGFGVNSSVSQSHTELAGNISVGALYYVTKHAGFGTELKGYGASGYRLVRFTAGVFYQFP